MQRLEVSGVVRLIYRPLGVEGLTCHEHCYHWWVPFSPSDKFRIVNKAQK